MNDHAQTSNSVAEHVPEVWEKVPPKNKNFTGREDLLAQLRAKMKTVYAVVPQPQALHGLGGVGKTQLAIEYAWRYRSHYEFVWWISADQRVLVPSALAGMAQTLNLPAAASVGIEEAADAVLKALQKGVPYRNWLLIFDNAEEPEAITGFIPRGPGHVLITSRNPRWESHVETLPVDVFDRAESIDFLRKRLQRPIENVEVDELAEKLGDLPLALEQAGALLTETGMLIEEYVTLLDEEASRLLGSNRAPGYPLSMTAAWSLSVSQLKDRMPQAVEVLRACAFFGPEPIPRDVFRRGNKAKAARLSPILSDPIQLATALGELGRFALARIDPANRTIQVHRLIQVLLRDDFSHEEQEAIRHEVHLLLAGAAPEDPDNDDQWSGFEELVAHVAPSRVKDCQDPSVREFALNIVRYLYQTGNYPSAQSFIEEFIDTWTRVSGPTHADVLVAREHLANVLRALGQYGAAFDVDRDTLDKMRENLGPTRPETLWAANGYGASLRARGQFLAARDLDEEFLKASEEVFGSTDPRTLRVMNSLALDYALTSDYQKARQLLQETFLEQSTARRGVSRSQVLATWCGLARAVRLCGDFRQACDIGEDAYAFGIRHLTLDHDRTLQAACDLSIARRRAGIIDGALELAGDVHTRLQRLFGDDHPDTMAAALNLSNALRVSGDLEAAMGLTKEVTPRYPEVYGDDHPYAYACKANLALVHRLRGEFKQARDLNEVAHKGLAARISRNHHYTLNCAINLASDHAALGDLDQAIELGRETFDRLTRSPLGADHFLTLACAGNLAIDLETAGEREQAKRLRDDTLERYAKTLGLTHADAMAAAAGRRVDCDFDPQPM
ncbi:tetratricopeptide repeat protein [Streptosporangiaceae bacterium NEAU-GS5]|nr:tetratricopeptide repeat protein [Streptosporangiaceae bacterium NEAU-GS5]